MKNMLVSSCLKKLFDLLTYKSRSTGGDCKARMITMTDMCDEPESSVVAWTEVASKKKKKKADGLASTPEY